MELAQLFPNLFLLGLLIAWVFSSREGELPLLKTIVRKFWITSESLLFMILSKDGKGIGPKYPHDADRIHGLPIQRKLVIFIRHGESDWNNIFNKGINPYLLVRLVKGFIAEAMLFFKMDSIFLDSPLNTEGIEQAMLLRKFLYERDNTTDDNLKKICSIIRGDEGTSVIASSTLRRAIATTTLSLWPRLEKTKEKICVLSNLQEIR